jgi:hypothetical protein
MSPPGENTTMSETVTTDKLIEDLQTVVRDAEALLRATAAQTGEKVQEVRARTEESVRQAKAPLSPLVWIQPGASGIVFFDAGLHQLIIMLFALLKQYYGVNHH